MPETSSATLPFYPAYCWPASPTYNTWVKLSAADVHALAQRPGYEGQRLYFHQNHPIRFIRLVGLVVSLDAATSSTIRRADGSVARTTRTPWTFALDDGSGATIDAVCWEAEGRDRRDKLATRPGEPIRITPAEVWRRAGRSVSGYDVDLSAVELGRVVKAKGWVGEYLGRRQVLLERVSVVRDTAAEVKAWEELAEFQQKVLSRPWVLDKGMVIRLQKRELRRQAKEAEKRRRKEKRAKRTSGDGKGPQEGVHETMTVPELVTATIADSAASRDQKTQEAKTGKGNGGQEQQERVHRTRTVQENTISTSERTGHGRVLREADSLDAVKPRAKMKIPQARDG